MTAPHPPRSGDLRLLSAADVGGLLADSEPQVLEAVKRAYLAHSAGETTVPHSLFLPLPGDPRNRIIALPAFVGGGVEAAGLKWIASVPANLEAGRPRASAVLLLNEVATGRLRAVLESSTISAWRTAASAALAAAHLVPAGRAAQVGLVGCGPINAAILRFLRKALPIGGELLVHDIDAARARGFAASFPAETEALAVRAVGAVREVLAGSSLVSFATTAAAPHVADLSPCAPGTTILHVSLRDLAPEILRDADNVVDDIDHVCRASTSLHLCEALVGHRGFIRCTLGDVLRGAQIGRRSPGGVSIFSPFGLGALDVALGALVLERAERERRGLVVEGFLGG
ncbi:2,3-diaminopropionate biosynthesis protein SbnB [Sorangium sp. So ce590]|uniref:2,3-diaminopropionate biosynthesis protein SbnB n=1 Tax=Sorangium sp. So ce590 TaxID=3133317 RepID=UPI003F5E06AF